MVYKLVLSNTYEHDMWQNLRGIHILCQNREPSTLIGKDPHVSKSIESYGDIFMFPLQIRGIFHK